MAKGRILYAEKCNSVARLVLPELEKDFKVKHISEIADAPEQIESCLNTGAEYNAFVSHSPLGESEYSPREKSYRPTRNYYHSLYETSLCILRQIKLNYHLPIVIHTGADNNEIMDALFKDYGADFVVHKNYDELEKDAILIRNFLKVYRNSPPKNQGGKN